ncbi:hypothetical protein SEUCBS139899_010052 [Sporothrix eucalyptigena]
MSDTSDYTIVDDTSSPSSSSSSSGSVQAQYKIIPCNTVNEVGDVLQLIQSSILAIHELLFKYEIERMSEDSAKKSAGKAAQMFVDMLASLGDVVAVLPEEGHVETAQLLTGIILEVGVMFATDGGTGTFLSDNSTSSDDDDYEEVLRALDGALVSKCLAQVQLIARNNLPRDPAKVETLVLHKPKVEQTIKKAIELHGQFLPDASRLVNSTLRALLPAYVRSLTAIYGSASGVSQAYVVYANSLLSELDKREETKDANGAGGEDSTTSTNNMENKGNEHQTTWWWALRGGSQVREWCSSLWR